MPAARRPYLGYSRRALLANSLPSRIVNRQQEPGKPAASSSWTLDRRPALRYNARNFSDLESLSSHRLHSHWRNSSLSLSLSAPLFLSFFFDDLLSSERTLLGLSQRDERASGIIQMQPGASLLSFALGTWSSQADSQLHIIGKLSDETRQSRVINDESVKTPLPREEETMIRG